MNQLDIRVIDDLLKKIGLTRTYQREVDPDDDNEIRIYSLYKNNTLVCKATIEREDEDDFHIKRIDTAEEFRSKGYGSIILYIVSCDVDKLENKTCTLTAFPINLSFYFKNGFKLVGLDMSDEDWYQLSIEKKLNLAYQMYNNHQPKDEFFMDGECHISLLLTLTDTTIKIIKERLQSAVNLITGVDQPSSVLDAYRSKSKNKRDYFESLFMGLTDSEKQKALDFIDELKQDESEIQRKSKVPRTQ